MQEKSSPILMTSQQTRFFNLSQVPTLLRTSSSWRHTTSSETPRFLKDYKPNCERRFREKTHSLNGPIWRSYPIYAASLKKASGSPLELQATYHVSYPQQELYCVDSVSHLASVSTLYLSCSTSTRIRLIVSGHLDHSLQQLIHVSS